MTVNLLQETGIGRTVNGLCKSEVGEVRLAAKSLVNKWKALVANESSADETAGNGQPHSAVEEKPRKDEEKIKREREHRSHHHHHQNKSHSSSSRHEGSGGGSKDKDKDKERHRHRHSSHNSEKSKTNGVPDEPEKHVSASSNSSLASDPQQRENHSLDVNQNNQHKSSNGDRKRSKDLRSNKGDDSDEKSSSKKKQKLQKEKAKKAVVSEDDNDSEIDCSAGTSFADALAMMDGGPPTPQPSKHTKNVTKNHDTSASTSYLETPSSSSSAASSSLSVSATSRLLSNTTKSRISNTPQSHSKPDRPLKLLAPSVKLPPLFDPEEMRRDILSAPVVINTSYTPSPISAAYINSAQISAAISKHKRPLNNQLSAAVDSATTFQIPGHSRARTKVYSGNKCAQVVFSLHELCIKILQKNIDGKSVLRPGEQDSVLYGQLYRDVRLRFQLLNIPEEFRMIF